MGVLVQGLRFNGNGSARIPLIGLRSRFLRLPSWVLAFGLGFRVLEMLDIRFGGLGFKGFEFRVGTSV